MFLLKNPFEISLAISVGMTQFSRFTVEKAPKNACEKSAGIPGKIVVKHPKACSLSKQYNSFRDIIKDSF